MSEALETAPPPQPDYSSYIAGWKRRQELEKAAIEKRRARARQIATQAVEILKPHGATKIILFGSVLDHTFKLDSDIDLAVEMPVTAWWKWYLKLGKALDFPIDLVHLDKVNKGFRKIILEFGEVIYEKEKWDKGSSSTD